MCVCNLICNEIVMNLRPTLCLLTVQDAYFVSQSGMLLPLATCIHMYMES